jgi:hypothetical protein
VFFFAPKRMFSRWKFPKLKPLHIVHRSRSFLRPNQHEANHHKVINFLDKVVSDLHQLHKRPSRWLLDPFKNMGCNAVINVVWAKVKVACFWVHPMWVSHGGLEAWGWTSTKEIVDIGCRV